MKFAATLTYRTHLKTLTLALSSVCALGLSSASFAQSNFGNQLFQSAVDAVKKQTSTQAPSQQSGNAQNLSNLPLGMVPQQKTAPEQVASYPNLSAFLEATRNGEFTAIGKSNINSDDEDVVAQSVISVLRNDYGVSPLPNDSACFAEFKAKVIALMAYINTANIEPLGTQPPDFINTNINSRSSELSRELNNLQTAGGWCDAKIMGQYRQHSYKRALPQLLTEYGKATQQWVETERNRRKAAYQNQQAIAKSDTEQRQREAQSKVAQRQAEEQKRIDADRARIEQDQKQRELKNKSRIAG
ncbi:MAG: hypothetical protein Q7T62_06440 [Undibacterium sp.]|nr:hypothetical protein [Undibacterium sp.]